MAIPARSGKTFNTWASVMMIAMLVVDASSYRFSKRGDASASWDVNAEKGNSGWGREREMSTLEKNVRYYPSYDWVGAVNTHATHYKVFATRNALKYVADLGELADMAVEFGLPDLLSQVGEVRQPGMPSRPKSPEAEAPQTNQPQYPPQPPTVGSAPGVPDRNPQNPSPRAPTAPNTPTEPDTPEAPRNEPVTPVEAPVPSESDASIILIERSTRLSVEGLISELTVDVGRKTRGFIFPMPPKLCAEDTDTADMPFPNGELRIPDDAASFVIPGPGVQTVKLSHPLLANTNLPLVVVMEHVEGGRSRIQSRAGSMQETCPLRVVQDSSTNDLIQRAISKPDVYTEDIVGQIFGGKFDELSGSYKILTHRFSQPHTLVMHFLVKLGKIDPVSLLHSTKTVLQTSEGFNVILPLANELLTKVDSEQISDKANTIDLPTKQAQSRSLPVDIPRWRR